MPKATRAVIDAARSVVHERDQGRCCMCGINLAGTDRRSVHHRAPKGMGGSALLESPANLVTLCGLGNSDGCHGKAHSNPQWARNHGWIVSRHLDPAEIPVDMVDGWHTLTGVGDRIPWEAP